MPFSRMSRAAAAICVVADIAMNVWHGAIKGFNIVDLPEYQLAGKLLMVC